MAEATTIEFILYRHGDTREKAILLSPDGDRVHAEWIPLSLVTEPLILDLVRPHGEAVSRGKFKMERWKAEELGWLAVPDEAQGALF